MREKVRQLLGERGVRVILELSYSPFWFRDSIYCWLKGLKWHPSWRFHGLPLVRARRRGSISASTDLILCSKPMHNSIGVPGPCILRTLLPTSSLSIGKNVGISGAVISARSSIEIGDNVLIGSGALITDSDAHSIDPRFRHLGSAIVTKPIRIENDVFIGARAIVLKGVTIGAGSVVGAGAVVSKSVPPGVIVAGNPARIVGSVYPEGASSSLGGRGC